MAFDNDSSSYWQSGVLSDGSSSTDGYGKDWVQVDVGQMLLLQVTRLKTDTYAPKA